MGVSVQADPRLSALLRALGLITADGGFDASWFEHPLDRVTECLDNDSQRAAVFELLDSALPPETGPLVPAGATWHPLVGDSEYGNVYLTVEDGVVGAAAVVGTVWTDLPSIKAMVRLPLLRTGNGPAHAEVGPLEVSVVATLAAAEGITSAGVRVRVGLDGTVAAVVRLEDASGAVTEFDPTSMDAEAVRAIELLVRSVLAYETGADPAVLSLITHLPGMFGLGDPALTPFPVADPSSARAWFAGIVGTQAALEAWFGHVAGVLGVATEELGATDGPNVSGDGTVAKPLRSSILEVGGVSLDLLVAGGGTAAQPQLMIGAGVSATLDTGITGPVTVGSATIGAQAMIAAIPLTAGVPATVLPSASALVTVPVNGGTVQGGASWDGNRIVPVLRLDNVEIAGTHETVDLTDARAVAAAAVQTAFGALMSAIGQQDNGLRLLALIGLAPPTTEPNPPQPLTAAALSGNLLTAISEVHRLALASGRWSYLFADLGGLFGLTAQAGGSGTRAQPWVLRLTGDDTFDVGLAAWDDATASTPAGEHLLRIGLCVTAGPADWKIVWSTEVLAFDLAPNTPTRIALVGAQNVAVEFTALPVLEDPDGFTAYADSLGVTLHWLPGNPAEVAVELAGLTVVTDGLTAGPLDLKLPGTPDPALPGIGMPVDPGDLVPLLRLLLTRGWAQWGNDLRAYAVAGLMGLHSDLTGLPADWPQLLPDSSTALAQLLTDPAPLVAAYARAVAGSVSGDGIPFAAYATGWLAALTRGDLPADRGYAPAVAAAGTGSHTDPWRLPAGVSGVDLLAWLDPAPPAPDHGIAALAAGEALLAALAARPEFEALLIGRDPGTSGYGLDALAEWLAGGDGLVPYESQVAVPGAWVHDTTVAVHHAAAPADPTVVTRVADQLTDWQNPPALLLVTASGTSWQAMLAGIDPGHDPDARIDLRGDPTRDLGAVTAVAGAYPIYLHDPDPGAATVAGLITQVGYAADRVRTLTGRSDVALVGHGPGGVLARIAAAQASTGIAGVVTICAPHAGTDALPLTDDALADAVRVADAIARAGGAPEPTVALLRAILDGGPPISGVLPPDATYAAETFAGVPDGITDSDHGLAIASRLPDGLVATLAAAAAAAVAPPAGAAAPASPVTTHVGFAARVPIPAPAGTAGQIAADLSLRVDLARLRVADSGPAPTRSAHEITFTARLFRPDGWLVGDGGARSGDAGRDSRAVLRARWAEVAITVGQDTSGGLSVTPSVRLADAGRPGDSAGWLTLPDIMTALTTQPDSLPLPAPHGVAALDGPVGALVTQLLDTLGLTDAAGNLSLPALRALVAAPAAALGPKLGAALAVLGPAAGATATAAGWQLPVLAGTHTLHITPGPWTLRATPVSPQPADTTDAGLFAGLTADVSLVLPGFTASGTAALGIGALRFTTDGTRVTLAMPPWVPEIQLAPIDPTVPVPSLATAVPRALVSATLGVFAGPYLASDFAEAPLDQLVMSPAATLMRMLGDGQWFTAAKVNTLLGTIGAILGALGAPVGAGTGGTGTGGTATTPTGLILPGDLRLHAVDPFALLLSGTFTFDPTTTLEFDLGLGLPKGQMPEPTGIVSVTLKLPGNWGRFTIEFGATPAGVTLAVQPSGADRIAILPRFDGLAAVASGVQALLPHLLQQLVGELPSGPVLTATLSVAHALGIYDPAAGGFEGTAQQTALAAMLKPGWLASVAGSGPAVATHIAALFGPPPLLQPPLGTIASSGSTVTWTIPLPQPVGGTLAAALGWDANGDPVVTLTAAGFRAGPLVFDGATINVGAQLSTEVAVHLALDGVLAPIAPAIEVGLAGDRFTARILPLGGGTANQIALTLAPAVEFDATEDGAFALALQWGLPLATEVIMLAVDGAQANPPLLERPFWKAPVGSPAGTPDGPTAHSVLIGAGLVPPTGAARLVHPLPDPIDAVLGGLVAAATGVSVNITETLTLALVHDTPTGRAGIRLSGYLDIDAGDTTVSLRFGTGPWFTDADSGVTLWLIGPGPTGGPALRIAPGLDATGLGVVFVGEPLVDGSVVIGGAGGLLFFRSTFLNAADQPALTVTHIGAGGVLVSSFVQLSSDDGDSFLAKVLPPSMRAPFDLAVVYRDGKLAIGGTGPAATGEIELVIPLDLELAVIQITELLLGMKIADGGLSLQAALSGNADIGPLYASVKRVGLIATFGSGGVGLRFRPPDEVGLSIDTSTLRVGGFLLVDAEHGRYVGGIEIRVLGKFEISAIGIITTKMPDGSPGFSLLFIISMKLPVPIALGYGFFFAGAGGLIGINRTIDLDALALGLRSGAAQHILFPEDIVRNADAIVRDLEAVFPIQKDQFLIGPMAMITWMSPPLISLQLGIVLNIGKPLKIAIIGLLRAALPDPDDAILDLKVAFVGAIDLGTQLLRFDASIYDSYLGIEDFKLSIDGDIAVRLGWGPQPDFVSSVGGFHPAFHPATYLHLPPMRRITLTLLRDNPSIVLMAYFALTANSLQIGTRLQFRFEVGGFGIVGEFGFDVLIQFSPFSLDAHVYAHLSVISGGNEILGIDMDFTLTGPTPWVARGTASFKVLCFSVSADFYTEFGPEATNPLTYVSALPALVKAFTDPTNWFAEFGGPTGSAVGLVPPPAPVAQSTGGNTPPPPPPIVLDPAGVLTVSQRILPLATDVTMFGTNRLDDISRVEVEKFVLGGIDQHRADASEQFSPAAYQTLSDEDKLKDASFVPRPSGVHVTGDTALRTDYVLARPATYDLIIADDSPAEHRSSGNELDAVLLGTFARGGATGKSAASRALRAKGERGRVVGVDKPADAYAVTSVGDLRARDADGNVATATVDASGNPVYGDGVLTDRTTAEQRARAAGAGFQVVPASQVVVA